MDPSSLHATLAAALPTLCTPAPALLRVVVHRRTERGYRSIATAEVADPARPAGWAWSPAPSQTAWRAVATHGLPVVVDASFGAVTQLDAAGQTRGYDGGPPLSAHSMDAILDRGVTHMFAAPLTEGAALVGMVCVELRALVGADSLVSLWPAVLRLVDQWRTGRPDAGVAGAHLTDDPLLPVLGPATAPVIDALRRFAARDETILLRGPTGVGKTRLAEWCHAHSPRAGNPFVTVNLHAIPPTLLEGELFGARRGTYTGAVTDQPGLVATAEGGTLFLDEIDKLDLGGQHKLLQLLESAEYRPLGERRTRHADVRFIVATNLDLERAVAEGRFRDDLYFRISVLPVEVPGLDERRDEIPLWAERFALDTGATLDPLVVETLVGRSWRGNLRQLDRFLRRAAALADPGSDGRPHIDAAAVERANAGESRPTETLATVAAPLVRMLAEQIAGPGASGAALTLDDLGFLKGLVLEEAARRMPLADVYRALGEHRLVDSRNHQAAFKREVSRALEVVNRWKR